MDSYSSFLFARPSFWEGMGRLMDFGGTLNEYNQSLSPAQADALALRADWRAVAQDIDEAARRYRRERPLRRTAHGRLKKHRVA